MKELKIVPMGKEHTEALAELEKLCFSRPWSRDEIEAELENPCACFFVALAGEKIAGYGGMQCAWGECYIANVAVYPEYRRQGVASALLQALEREARAREGEFLSLEVRPSNRGAVALYEKLGFAEAGRRKDFYSSPKEDGLIMTKRF